MEDLQLEDVIQDSFDALCLNMWTALPARVVAFDVGGVGKKPTATVQPFPSDYAAGDPVPIPQLAAIPVCYPPSIRWSLSVGDVCLVMFASRSLERYRGEGAEGDPQSFRHHDLSDAWILPILAGNAGAAVGTGLKAARVTDTVGAGATMAAWIVNVNAALLALGQTVAPPSDFGSIATGSPNVEID